MRVLIVSQFFKPERFLINDLAESLASFGIEIEVLTSLPNYPDGSFLKGYSHKGPYFEIWKKIRIFRCPAVPRGRGTAGRLILNYSFFAFFGSIRALSLIFRKYDAIFVFGTSPVTAAIPAIVLKHIKRLPIVYWVQDLWPESVSATGFVTNPALLSFVRLVSRFVYRQSDRILVQSEAFRAPMEKFGIPLDKITYFPNSADSNIAKSSHEMPSELRALPESKFRIIFAGNIGHAQDFPTIVSAFNRLKALDFEHKIQLIVLGDGSIRKAIERLVLEKNLQSMIFFLGSFPVERMSSFFQHADALLVSLNNDQIFSLTIPSKVQSYMASGRPIVASLRGEGHRIVCESKCGVVSAPECAEELAESIKKMYFLPQEKRESMGLNGLAYFKQNFEKGPLMKKLHHIFLELSRGTI